MRSCQPLGAGGTDKIHFTTSSILARTPCDVRLLACSITSASTGSAGGQPLAAHTASRFPSLPVLVIPPTGSQVEIDGKPFNQQQAEEKRWE